MMAKSRPQAEGKSKSHRHIEQRTSYLFEATKYLSQAREQAPQSKDTSEGALENAATKSTGQWSTRRAETRLLTGSGQDRFLLSQMRAVAMKGKGQIRLPQDKKRTVCKRCSSLLVGPSSHTNEIENASVRREKRWADVKVVTCLACGAPKRFPIGMQRQSSKKERKETAKSQEAKPDAPSNGLKLSATEEFKASQRNQRSAEG